MGQTKGVICMQHYIVSFYDANRLLNSAIMYYDSD